MKGEISLGVGSELYEGVFEVNRQRKTITYSFARPLPAPYSSDEVVKTYTRFHKLLPYELAGQMVNDIIALMI